MIFHIALQLSSELDNLLSEGDNDERRLLCKANFKRFYIQNGKNCQDRDELPFCSYSSQ
jgi:hypothetical protein